LAGWFGGNNDPKDTNWFKIFQAKILLPQERFPGNGELMQVRQL